MGFLPSFNEQHSIRSKNIILGQNEQFQYQENDKIQPKFWFIRFSGLPALEQHVTQRRGEMTKTFN
jgi:hypothetical protein